MSKKNRNHKRNINFKVESLEPRLMMDGSPSDTDWCNELDDINISSYTIPTLDSESIEGLVVYEENDSESVAETMSLADVLKSTKIDFSSEFNNVKAFINSTINDLKKESTDSSDMFQLDATTLCNRLKNDNTNSAWGFEERQGKIEVTVTISTKVSISDNSKIVPDIAEKTNIDVIFEELNASGITGNSSLKFFIDGDASSDIEKSMETQVAFRFKQDLSSSETKNAKIGILELQSIADVNENDPDLEIIGRYTVDKDGNKTFNTTFNYDLDFKVKDDSSFLGSDAKVTGFDVDDLTSLKYKSVSSSIDSPLSAKWESGVATHDENDLISSFANIQMGNILNQLSSVSKLLQNAETDVLNNNFEGLIDQNASSFLRLSTFFDDILKTPPRSIQDLLKRCSNLKIEFDSNCNFFNLKFSLSNKETAKAALTDIFLKELSESLSDLTKNSLSLSLDSFLNLTLKVPMATVDSIEESTRLSDLGISCVGGANTLIGNSNAVMATNALNASNNISGDISFNLIVKESNIERTYSGLIEQTSITNVGDYVTTSLNSIYKDSKGITTSPFTLENEGNRYAVIADLASVEFLSLGFTAGNSKEIGLFGTQLFKQAYLIDCNKTSTKIGNKSISIKKSDSNNNEGDLVVAINDFLMGDSAYADYSAVKIGNKIFIIYQPSGASNSNPWSLFTEAGGETKLVAVSSTLPVDVPSKAFTITIDVNKGSDDSVNDRYNLSFEDGDFKGCYTVNDVEKVVSKKLKEELGKNHEKLIQTAVRDERIVFYCDDYIFSVSGADSLGITTGQTSNRECVEIIFDDDSKTRLDLSTLYSKIDVTIDDVLEEIANQFNLKNCGSVSVNGLTLKFSGCKVKSIENANGFSLVTLLGLTADQDGATDSFTVKGRKNSQIEIAQLDLNITEKLTGKGKLVSGVLGMVGVDLTGEVGVSATRTFSLKDSETIIDAVNLYDDDGNVTEDVFASSSWNYDKVDGYTNSIDILHKNGLNEHAATMLANVSLLKGSLLIPSVVNKQQLSAEEALFKNVSMSTLLENVKNSLQETLLQKILSYGENSTKFDNLSNTLKVLNQKLPLFGKSAPELLGLINKVNDVISNISANQPKTLQELNARLQKLLGASLYFIFNETSVDYTFKWDANYNHQSIPVSNFSLVDSINIGGNAEIYMNGSLNIELKFNMAMTEGKTLAVPTLKEDSCINFDVQLIGTPLSFDLSVALGDYSGSLLQVVSESNGTSYLCVAINETFKYKKTSTDEDSSLEWVNEKDDCKIGGELHIECLGLDAGTIKLGVMGQNNINSWDGTNGLGTFNLADIVEGKVGVKLPGFFDDKEIEKGNSSAGSIVLDLSDIETDFEKIDFFGQIRLVTDALSTVLRKAQSSLNKTFLSDSLRKIPLVGDSIVSAADCLTDLDEKFIEPLRKFAYSTQDMNAASVAAALYSILQKTGLLGTLSKEVSDTQSVAWAGSIFNKSYNDKNGKQCIQYNESGESVEWRFCLSGSYDLDANADFDLGLPGLGLTSKGGVDLKLEWKWYLGFGISKNGAYILLSNGSDEGNADKTIVVDGIEKLTEVSEDSRTKTMQLSGDDILVTLTVTPNVDLKGSLGFLQMSGNLVKEKNDVSGAYENIAEGDATFSLSLGIDLNDGEYDSTDAKKDKTSDKNASTKINVNNVSRDLSLESNLNGNLDLNVKMTLGFDTDSVDIGFPEIGAIFSLKWDASFGKPSGDISYAGLKDIYFNAGAFVTRTIQPVLKKIQKVIDPLMPLIEFLQSEIPVLSSLPKGGSKMTVLSLIQSVGSAKGLNLGMLDDIVKIAKTIDTVSGLELDKIDLGSMDLLTEQDSNERKASVSNFLAGTSVFKNDLFTPQSVLDNDSDWQRLKSKAQQDLSILKFPFLLDKNNNEFSLQTLAMSTVKLLFGQDVTLIEYDMSPLTFDFDWSKSFAIVGPLCADIGFNFGVNIDLCFGYDTFGLRSWKNSGFKDLWALTDGFYINDLKDNKDVSEVVFFSGINAGASVAGRAGINVGVNLNLNLNFDDPNNDGKIRLTELADNLARSPLAMFDSTMTMQARAYAYLDLFFYRKEWNLWKSGALELFNTDSTSKDTPIVATEQNGDVVVNVGLYAEKRLNGDLSDGDDKVTVACNGDKAQITIEGSNIIQTTKEYVLNGNTLYVYSGKDNDKVIISGNASFNIVIEGGNDDDSIDLSGLTLAPGFYAVVLGGNGNDYILGSKGSQNFLFGGTGRVDIKETDGKKYVSLAEVYPDSTNDGNNVIVGGKGKNFIFGGIGNDYILGGVNTLDNTTENHLFGDFGSVMFDATSNLIQTNRYDLYEDGGNDTILGGNGRDYIYGGAGNDSIDGREGNDEIHAGKGNDVVYGGSGSDVIYGDDGVDVIFGDSVNSGFIIAEENNMTTAAMPYAYVSEELKKSQDLSTTVDDGNNSPHKKLATYDFVTHYGSDNQSVSTFVTRANEVYSAQLSSGEDTEPEVESFDDIINGGNGSDIILGNSGNDIIEGGAGNDLIKGNEGDDIITGGFGEDLLVGGQGNDILDGGAGNDIVFGDDGWTGYANKGSATDNLFTNSPNDNQKEAQNLTFGYGITAFAKNFEVFADSVSNNDGGADTIIAGNGSDFVDGQSGDDSYIVNMMGGGNRAYTNVMDSGEIDAADSLTINGTINNDQFLVRASNSGLGMVAMLPELGGNANDTNVNSQIERVNFWNVGGQKTGIENLAVNAGAGDDRISIDGTLSTISIDAGAGNDTVTVGQMFNSERTTDTGLSNVLLKDIFDTTRTTQGYLSNGVEHATSIIGGEGDDTFNVLHNKAAVSLSGGLGDDTFNVAMYQKDEGEGKKSIVENGPVTLIGGTGTDKMSIAGSEGDDSFVISHGRVFGEGIDVQSVSIEDKNVYGGDGDDSFYVLDTEENEVTKLYGNKGNDSFHNGGVGSADMPAFLNATATDSEAINVVFVSADDNSVVLDTPYATLPENGNTINAYALKLDRAPKADEIVSVTVFAPVATTEAHGRGDREVWLVDGEDKLCKSITFKFAATADLAKGTVAWNALQTVKVNAIGDSVREGDDYFSLLHNVVLTPGSSTEASKVNACKNALVFLDEIDNKTNVDNKFSVTQEVIVTGSDVEKVVENGVEKVVVKVVVDSVLLPSSANGINAWYIQNGSPESINAEKLSVNEGVLTIDVSDQKLAAGTRIYFNYQHEEVLLDDESIVQMAYSTEDMTDVLEFAPMKYDADGGKEIPDEDSKITIYAESLLESLGSAADDVRYVYRTAGTQIIILDRVSRKTVSLRGKIALTKTDNSFNHPHVMIFDEANSFQNVSKEEIVSHMQDDTIENIKGALYEDGMGKEFSLENVGPAMLHYSTEPDDDNAEKNVASTADSLKWADAAQTAADYDESQSVDRVFTNNMKNTKAGEKNDLESLTGSTEADAEWIESDSQSIRFTHKDSGSSVENRIGIGNMEYGEFNLGTGADTVDIHKSIYREDGFQTFTVVNSGKGNDAVTVHSYKDGSDDQLVINAGEGNDTVTATDENVTREGLIVFGGLGDDRIDIGSDSSLVFGDRGQVLYHDDDGNVVTRLGDDRTGTPGVGEEDEEWNAGGSDYATGKNKDSEAYKQTDGVRRGPSIARTVTESQGGNDVINLANGRNVVFGGVNATRTDSADASKLENEKETISTGNGDDLVFGDEGYATFGGHAAIAKNLGQENASEIRDEATLSFNFVGNSQTGLSSEAVAGALNASHNDDFRSDHWNNIGGTLSGTYGNDDREIVCFDDGTRASAVSVSYGGIERHRTTGTDNRINLQGYSHNFANSSTDANAALMNSGLMTTAPNSQNENKLEVSVDGLAQYFTHYSVIVYLDLPDSNSADTNSIRKISLFLESSTKPVASYFVNDAANHNFNGSYDRGTATSAELATSANYVVFDVAAGTSIDRFRVVIEEAFPGQSPNGKNLPGIAAIQVNGSLHAQDVAASSDIAHGGDDTISTGGGDDIVVGGTGGDKITTYGDERYGIYDNDVVFGDSAKMVFTDRDNSGATASMLSMAESLDSRDIEGNYADRIITGNGNDVVVGGLGADYIDSGATADADSMLDGIKVVSFNFTRENATAVEMVAPGEYIPVLDDNNSPVYENGEQKFNFIPHETAGVVADNDWTNLYIKNNRLHIVGENENNSDTPVKHDGVGISLVAYDTAVGNGTQNSSLMLKDDAQLDGDTSNSRLFNAYYAAQQQQEIKLTLTGLDTFRTGSELGASAACDVYVYLGGDQQGVDSYNYLFDVCGRQPGGNTLDQHYYLNDWTGNHFDGDYRQVTCSVSPTKEDLLSQVAPDMSLIGNYVVFRNVTSATFEVRIRNLFTDTNQWPLNLPVITAVQVVAVADRKDDIAIGGDHDKDLVFGDDARVTFDIDLPFARNENQADYANRAVEAQSIHIDGNAVEIPLDGDGKPVEMGDTILTGRDRDVIVGGDFGDTITMGDGDDVAIGDNASIILEHNNPIGVFAPSVEIMLEQHSVNTSNGEVFLGNDNTQASQIQSKFENGGVPGVTLEASTNGGTDTFTDATGKDWTLQQETSSTTESGTGGSTTDSGTGGSTTDSGTGDSTTDSGTGDSTTDSGTGDSTTDSGTEDDTTSDITVDLFYIEEPLQIQAGTKLHIVCTGIVPNPWWRPYVIIFPAGSALPQLRYLTEDGTPGEIIQPENNEYRILIPEVSNGEVSPVIHVVSDGNGLINATMG